MSLAGIDTNFTLPSRFYTSTEIFEEELERIFYGRWIYVACEADIPKAGDYVTLKIGKRSIFLQRTESGEVRGFYNVCRHRGHVIEHQLAAALELFPIFSRAQVLRTWGGIVDIAPDASPIIGITPVENLFINCGWGTGGFKATPGSGWVMRFGTATSRSTLCTRGVSFPPSNSKVL